MNTDHPYYDSQILYEASAPPITSGTSETDFIEVQDQAMQIDPTLVTGLNCQQICPCALLLCNLLPTMVEDSVKNTFPTLVSAMGYENQAMGLQIESVRAHMEQVVTSRMEAMRLHMDQRFSAITSLMENYQTILGHDSSLRLKTESSESWTYQLQFRGNLPSTFTTSDYIQNQKAELFVVLLDEFGNCIPPEPNEKVEIFVLDGDFDPDTNWTAEEFKKSVVEPRKDKGPLLRGECVIFLREGGSSVGKFSFTDNSSKSTKNGLFRFGARVVPGLTSGVRIKEAVSQTFIVKESRGNYHEKHEFPKLRDEIWRLQNISAKGTIYKRFEEKAILKVEEFLQLYNVDKKALQEIAGVCGKRWQETVKHAKSCELNDERYEYVNTNGVMLLLNCVYDILEVTFPGQGSQTYHALPEPLKELVDGIRLDAYYNRRNELRKIDNPTNQISGQDGGSPAINMHNIRL